MKSKIFIIILIIACVLSFISGRLTINKNTEYVYLPQKTDTITNVVEKTTYNTKIVKVPTKKDTIDIDGIERIVESVDTSKIISEYIVARDYSEKLFSNEKDGTLVVNATVQYNKLSGIGYVFTPVKEKQIKQNLIEPFVSLSYSTYGYISAGGGVFLKNTGLEVKYVRGIDQSGIEFGVKYKF